MENAAVARLPDQLQTKIPKHTEQFCHLTSSLLLAVLYRCASNNQLRFRFDAKADAF